ncbi:hypothetical protein [Agreia sp. COWG]|uniref:hypothetical protein n=1 Tax=Agreia sp. COWG TaxID=2773266 RepID=UPI0019256B21|nr:hypothetical protein [Agreia sp. COWG]CAD5999202.1 conserved protein of unknown function [Agreia sp. COWG]
MTRFVWEGVDGSVWDFADGPVRLTDDGIEGFGELEAEELTSNSSMSDGNRFQGVRWPEREMTLGLAINAGLPRNQWQACDRAFWNSVSATEYGTMHVFDVFNDVRHIAARFRSDNRQAHKIDPSFMGYSRVLVDFVADDPWFRGPTVLYEVDPPPADEDFFGPTGYGPPFFISSGTTVDATTLFNPGDLDAWPIWNQLGPSASFSFTVAGHTLAGEIAVPDGGRLELDTRPNRKTARLYAADGSYEDVFRLLDTFDFGGRIPKRATSPVDIVTVGTGTTLVSFEPLYKRGF